MKVWVVFEYLEDGSPIKGVFDTGPAAGYFIDRMHEVDPLGSFDASEWEIENINDVREKWTKYQTCKT